MEQSSSSVETVENVTELMQAAADKHFGRMSQLLDGGQANLAAADSTGKVALHYSAEAGNIKVFKRIYDADPSLVDHTDKDGYAPINFALIGGQTDIVEFLLNKGSDPNHVDAEKHSLVHWATVCARPDLLEMLLKGGALPSTPDLYGAHALHYCTQLFAGPDGTVGAEIMHILLKDGAFVNSVDEDGRSPLLWAASSGSKEAFLNLVQAGADKMVVDKDQLGVLHCAASRGHPAIIESMFQLCADLSPDPSDRNGATPLFYAVTLGHVESAKLLLHCGSNPNHQDRKGRSAAHCGASKGQLATLKVLQQFGASFQLQNYRGDLPIHEAVQTGSKDVVEWLLSVHGSTASAANHEGRTPLHLAAATDNLELCELFCKMGANINPLMLFKGDLATPLDLADFKGNQEIVDFLRRHQGKTSQDLPERLRRASKEFLQTKVAEAKSARPADFTSTDFSSDGAKGRLNKEDRKPKRRGSSRNKQRAKIPPKAVLKDSATNTEQEQAPSDEEDTVPQPDTSASSQAPPTSSTDRPDKTDSLLSTERTLAEVEEEAPPTGHEDQSKKDSPHKIRFRLVDELENSQSVNSDVTIEVDSATARKLKKTGHSTKRYAEEKRIFQELANLKRVQIQYGKVQEGQLVKGLMDNFLKNYNTVDNSGSNFRSHTFSAWEKFLYEQLKHIYEQERQNLSTEKRDRLKRSEFNKRLSRPPPKRNDARIEQLIKTYGVAPLPMQYSPRLHGRP